MPVVSQEKGGRDGGGGGGGGGLMVFLSKPDSAFLRIHIGISH